MSKHDTGSLYEVTIFNPRDTVKGQLWCEHPDSAADYFIDAAEFGAMVHVENEVRGLFKYRIGGKKIAEKVFE